MMKKMPSFSEAQIQNKIQHLREMIKKNPQKTATILKGWISEDVKKCYPKKSVKKNPA